jgi:hypothetical protein
MRDIKSASPSQTRVYFFNTMKPAAVCVIFPTSTIGFISTGDLLTGV